MKPSQTPAAAVAAAAADSRVRQIRPRAPLLTRAPPPPRMGRAVSMTAAVMLQELFFIQILPFFALARMVRERPGPADSWGLGEWPLTRLSGCFASCDPVASLLFFRRNNDDMVASRVPFPPAHAPVQSSGAEHTALRKAGCRRIRISSGVMGLGNPGQAYRPDVRDVLPIRPQSDDANAWWGAGLWRGERVTL